MISKVGFKNFRVLADVEVELEPFTVLVGPNASGKSTILDGLHRIASMRKSGIKEEIGVHALIQGADFLGGALEDDLITPDELLTKFDTALTARELMFSYTPANSDTHSIEFNKLVDGWYVKHIYDSVVVSTIHFEEEELYGSQVSTIPFDLDLPQSIYLQLSKSRVSAASFSNDVVPSMASDGSGLASMLADIKLRDLRRFQAIEKGLRSVVSSVNQVNLERRPVQYELKERVGKKTTATTQTLIGNYLVFDFQGAKGVPARDVSEGTLFALAILSIATDMESSWLILLDDLERGLHPLAVGDLVKVLKNLVKENPKLQIVATTHSPDLLNYVDAHEVRVVNLNEQGHTIVAKLTDHPEYERWKDTLKPGEFWAEVGENWVKRQVVER